MSFHMEAFSSYLVYPFYYNNYKMKNTERQDTQIFINFLDDLFYF